MDNSGMDNATTPDMTQAPVETAQQASERMFKQAELNEIVGRAKHEAVESFKRQQAQQAPQQPQYQQQSNSKALSEDDVKRLTGEELNRHRDEWTRETQERAQVQEAERIVNAYKEKISAGKDKYQDFDAVTNNVDMRYYPNVVQLLAEHVDNSHDVLYDLAKNRSKLYQIESACQHNPQDAIYEIKRLSDSIKANEQQSTSTLSLRDLKQKYRA